MSVAAAVRLSCTGACLLYVGCRMSVCTSLAVCAFLQPTPEAWLAKIHEDPAFNSTFGPWLRTLPERGEIFAPDGMTEEEIAMLQGGPLVRIHVAAASSKLYTGCHLRPDAFPSLPLLLYAKPRFSGSIASDCLLCVQALWS
jgi:hypothetical protein